MKSTPGPWKATKLEGGKRGSGAQWIITGTPLSRIVLAGLPCGTAEQAANVHLIAAAPELLQACKDMLKANCFSPDTCDHESCVKAKAAIVKAAGL